MPSRSWIALLVLLVGCDQAEVVEQSSVQIRPARIITLEDTAQTLQYSFVGQVEALQSIDVSFEVSGPLTQLPIREGQAVPEGALLAALDPTDFELALREAEVQVRLARQDLERKRSVLQQKGIARSVVDDAQAQYDLQVVRLGQARERLADSRLTAPFDAVIARRFVDNFVIISPGTRVVRLHDVSQLLVVANVPESLLATATPDQVMSMYATFDFSDQQQFPLALYENRGEASQVAQTYEVSLVMKNPEAFNILPGMSATVQVNLRDPDNTQRLYLPADALVADAAGGFFVWRYLGDDGVVERQPVQVGSPELAGIPILDGLAPGMQVVGTGAQFLQPGMRVRPLE